MEENKSCIRKPRVMMPKEGTDLNKWAVIACDQFTSPNEDYWQKVEEYVGEAPSTLNLIFPEYYLADKENVEKRIAKIQETMKQYLADGVMTDALGEDRFIYTRRKLSNGKTRQGLVVLLDLEVYSYKKGEKPTIRSTEGIVEERLPIRMQIRRGAPLEFPHILMLIDDSENRMIEPLGEDLSKHSKLYDFDLMMNGGHAEGYAVIDETLEKKIWEVMESLGDQEIFMKKYGLSVPENPLAIAVGDGNHSLASAKGVWEETKEKLMAENKEWQNHPARFAMVELINVHDEALEFEPINRVLFGVGEWGIFEAEMQLYMASKGTSMTVTKMESKEDLLTAVKSAGSEQKFGVSTMENQKIIWRLVAINNPVHSLTVGSLQMFLDDYLSKHNEVKIDYIHGEDGVIRDSSTEGNIGFFLPVMGKTDLFKAVIKDGVTPRKTFSMGEADTKAYYILGHRITED